MLKVRVGVSNRHVHLTKDTYRELFNKDSLEKRNDLNQIGEFASTDTVNLQFGDRVIEHVRIVGPFRKSNQIELLKSDAEYLNIDAPIRRSGDLHDTPSMEIINDGKSITSDGVIRAERHLHVPSNMESEINLHERDKVHVITGDSSFDANVKVSDNGFLELHIDRDEAEEYKLSNGDEVEVQKCGK